MAPSSPLKPTRSGGSASSEHDVGHKEGTYDWRATFSKAMVSGADWPDKDELLDVLYWLRQIVSVLIGLVWALVPFHGFLALALYVALSTVVGHFYITVYQKQDEDSLGGAWEMAKEGFGSGFASFMIMWIVGYSALHFS